MNGNYYNTTGLNGVLLAQCASAAEIQDKRIMRVMKKLKKASPSQVLPYMKADTPLTSVRRGMNSLTKEGRLVMLQEKRIGPYGRPEHYWKVA